MVVGCGGGGRSVCGNGKTEPGEDCDNGAQNGQPGGGCSATCTFVNLMRTAVEVRWTINAMAAPMFESQSCYTLAAPQGQGYQVYARVMLSGPAPMSGEYKCSDGSHVFIDQPGAPLRAGTYMVTARLFERNDTTSMDLTQDVTTMITVPDQQQATATVNFPWDEFNQIYTGHLFFQTAGWERPGDADAGTSGSVVMGCSNANVNKVRLWLRRSGQPVTPPARSTGGEMLDGSGPYDCHTPTGPTDNYYTVRDLPWGPYDLVVGGYVNPSQLAFCSVSQVFVGAGATNPTYRLTTRYTTAPSCP